MVRFTPLYPVLPVETAYCTNAEKYMYEVLCGGIISSYFHQNSPPPLSAHRPELPSHRNADGELERPDGRRAARGAAHRRARVDAEAAGILQRPRSKG